MKKSFKQLMLCTFALLLGGANVQAATETYDFKAMANTLGDANEHYPTYTGAALYTADNAVKEMTFTDFALNGRFAANERASAGFNLRKSGDWVGLNSGYNAVRYFSILNLEAGDKVTITYDQGALYKNNITGSATVEGLDGEGEVTSANTYNVTAAGRLDLKTGTSKANITKIVIETSVTTETIHIGKRTKTYNFESVANNTAFKNTTGGDVLATADNDFDSRFALGRYDSGCKFGGSGYGLQIWFSNRTFTIKDLKAGDTFAITFEVLNTQTLVFNAPAKVGLTDATKTLTSGTTYTVAEAGDIVIATTDNTADNRASIKNVTIIDSDASVTAGTLVSSTALDFTGSDVKAYYASSASAGTVTFSPINKVAAGTPIYIKADAAGKYEIPVLDGDADAATGNLLKGSAASATPLQSTEETKYYVFGVKGSDAGFYPVSTSSTLTSAAGKAYLQLTAEQAAAARLTLNFEDSEATAIESTKAAVVEDNAWYTLQGVRVATPTKGIYVKNGKKVYVK